MATTRRHKNDEEEARIPRTEFERSSQESADKKTERSTTKRDKQVTKKSQNLTREQKKVKDSYFYCCENFYSLPEMINYMKVNHGLPKTTVTNVFRELLTGRNAEAYLRVSQRRALERSSNGASGSVGSSSSFTK